MCVECWVFFKVFSQNSSTFLRASFFLNLSMARFKTNKSPHPPPNTLAIFFKKLQRSFNWKRDLELDKKVTLLLRWTFSNLSEKSVSIWPIHKALDRNQASCSSHVLARGQLELAGFVLW